MPEMFYRIGVDGMKDQDQAASRTVVPISALTRISSVRITCCINEC